MAGRIELSELKFEGPYDIENKINIPKKCGVYIFYDINMQIMYIGKATNLRARFRDHYNPKTSKVAMAREVHELAIQYYSYAVTEMIEDAEMYEMIYTRLKNPVLAKMSIKDIDKEILNRYKECEVEKRKISYTVLPIPKKKIDDIVDRKTFRVNYRIYNKFMDLAKSKYSNYKQQDLMTLALQMFIDKYE